MADTRPHTREFSQEDRDRLGLAVQRAREDAGHPYRPSFAEFAGPPLGVRSLLKLEKGAPVGASVYEAAGRSLGRLLADWSVEVPLEILRGMPAPKGIPITGGDAGGQAPVDEPAEEDLPDPAQYADQVDFLRATIETLRRQGMPHEAIMLAVQKIVEESERNAAYAERNQPDTPRGQVS